MKSKILFIKTNSIKNSIDGIDKLLIEFAKCNYNNNNYEFKFLFNIKCKCSEQVSKYASTKIINFPDPYFKSIIKKGFNFLKTWKFLISYKPDFIVELSPYHYMISFILNRKAKTILYYHSINFKQKSKIKYFQIFSDIRENIFFNFHGRDLIIVTNKLIKDKLLKEGKCDKNIFILKNGYPKIKSVKNINLQFCSNKNKKIKIIGVGRLNLRKGGEEFCQFAKYINSDRFEFSYIGVLKNRKLNFYKKMTKYVNFIGHIDDVFKYLIDSDIALHFSHEEAGSMIIREMMSAGLPIIAWNVATVDSDLKHQADFLIDKGDFKEAKNKLLYLADNLEVKYFIGLKNQFLASKYPIESMYLKFLNIINKIK